jgi:sortase A
VPESEQAMSGDSSALPLLALCLALLLALTLGLIAARQRWSTALVWVVAAPLTIGLSWVTTDVVMRPLPNLI